jgi:hypothetical protein
LPRKGAVLRLSTYATWGVGVALLLGGASHGWFAAYGLMAGAALGRARGTRGGAEGAALGLLAGLIAPLAYEPLSYALLIAGWLVGLV